VKTPSTWKDEKLNDVIWKKKKIKIWRFRRKSKLAVKPPNPPNTL